MGWIFSFPVHYQMSHCNGQVSLVSEKLSESFHIVQCDLFSIYIKIFSCLIFMKKFQRWKLGPKKGFLIIWKRLRRKESALCSQLCWKTTGLNVLCLNPTAKKPQKSSQKPTHLWEQVLSPHVTICKRIAVFCKFFAPVSRKYEQCQEHLKSLQIKVVQGKLEEAKTVPDIKWCIVRKKESRAIEFGIWL